MLRATVRRRSLAAFTGDSSGARSGTTAGADPRTCEHTFVTADGRAYARFRRALDTGNLTLVRAAAAELPHVDLPDALRVCWLLREEPDAYEKAAIRWLGRFCLERDQVTLDQVETALAAFEDLPLHGQPALERLRTLCGGRGSGRAERSRRTREP
jgi:hypothetical protein